MLAILVCIFASCSDGGSDNPVNPTPKPEEVKTEITIDSGIVSNGLSFGVAEGEQSVSFSVNANWTLSIASTTSGATWCKASVTSGNKGTTNVKFTVEENTGYEDRSVSVTIKAGSVSKTFTITQKGADALLVTTTKYEVEQEGGQIEIEVKANIDYQMTISETAKDWIGEVSGRALTTHKHKLNIAMNEDAKKREGEIYFKSGDKVETVKVYQAGGAIILLSQDEYTVSDAGETISVDIKSNVEYGVQMPDVDWITDEASGRGMSSHTLKYIVSANETYDSRSAEIIFYDKNSDLKDTLKVVQAQKDAIVISQKEYNVKAEGETIEVKLSANVDFEVTMPEVDWIKQVSSRALKEHTLYFEVTENVGEESRSASISFVNKECSISEQIVIEQYAYGKITQEGEYVVATLSEPGSLRKLLGDEFLKVSSLKINGPFNGDDLICIRLMSTEYDSNLSNLDLSEVSIVEGGSKYSYRTSDGVVEKFDQSTSLQNVILPKNAIRVGYNAFSDCKQLKSIIIGNNATSIGQYAFHYCSNLTSVVIGYGVVSIEKEAFFACDSLESITIPDNVQIIGKKAFNRCALKKIVIGKNIKTIEELAFNGLVDVEECYCYATNPPELRRHDNHPFIGYSYPFQTDSESVLYVPKGCSITYKESFWGGCFTNIVEMD